MFAPVNLLAVFVGTLAFMMIGMFWYSPAGFGNKWAQLNNMSLDMRPAPMDFLGAAIVAFLASWSMAQLIAWVNPFMLAHAMTVGFVAWLGLIAAPRYSQVIWAHQHVTIYLIDVSALLVKTMVLSVLFYFWR